MLLALLLLFLLAAVLGMGFANPFGRSSRLPTPTIVSAPPSPTFSTSAHFRFSDARTVNAFMCSLDGAPPANCGSGTSGAVSYSGLAAGLHTFSVYALSGSRQSGPAVGEWTVAAATPGHAPPLDGAGTGNGDVTAKSSAVRFRIAGDAVGQLYPGGSARPVNLVVTNPNSVAIEITSVKMTVSGTSTAACDAGNFEIIQNLVTAPATVVVPANSTRSLGALGIPRSQWPKLRMLGGGGQDGCKGATVNLSYNGTAHP